MKHYSLSVDNQKVSLLNHCGSYSATEGLFLYCQLLGGMFEKSFITCYGSLILVDPLGIGRGNLIVLCSSYRMENHTHSGRCPLCETIDIHRVLGRQESLITDNRT
jgi:hypothetical protein